MNSFPIKVGTNKALRAPALRDSPETVSSAGCDRGGHPGPLSSSPPHHPALSSSLTLAQLTREHAATSSDNICMDRKYGLAPSLPVSPCHRHSVNTVLDSEKQNLFSPPGRQETLSGFI